MIRLSVAVAEARLPSAFRVSHTSFDRVQLVTLRFVSGDHVGVGEVAVGPWMGEAAEDVAAAATELATRLTRDDETPSPAQVDAALRAARDRRIPATTRLLVEMAFLDHAARVAAQPLWQLLGLEPPQAVDLWQTLGVGEALGAHRARRKVKLGGDHDAALLATLAGRTEGELIVDVNGGWDRARWQAVSSRLGPARLTALEDPVAVVLASGEGVELLADVRAELGGAVPLILDESVRTAFDVELVAAHADGANVKLAKFGGLMESRRALERLRQLGLRTMLGCFIEPPRAIAYAAQLAGSADWADLDGHVWLHPREFSSELLELEHEVPGAPSVVAIAG